MDGNRSSGPECDVMLDAIKCIIREVKFGAIEFRKRQPNLRH